MAKPKSNAKPKPKPKSKPESKSSSAGSLPGLRRQLEQKNRELNEALEQQAATADVLKTISGSTFDLAAVLETLARSAAKLCRADRAAIRLLKDGALHHLASYGFTAQQRDFMMKTAVPAEPHRGSIAGRVLLEGKIVQIKDSKADPDFRMTVRPDFADVRTVLGAPLLRGDRLIGLLILSRKAVEPFTAKQIELIATFADQAVIAIENARLLSELRQSLEQQTATSEVLGVISSSPGELEPVFRAMLENATRICEAKFGTLALCEGDALRAVALHGGRQDYADERRRNPVFRPAPNVPVMRAVRMKQVQHVADMLTEQAYIDRDAAVVTMVETGGARTFLAVPMVKDDEAVGVIIVYRQEVRPFTDKQIALVQNFAAQAVIAIENTRLLSELRQSLERQTATSEVLKVISSSPGDLQPVFASILENATRICGAKFGTLFLREGEAVRTAALYGSLAKEWDEQWQIGTLFQPDSNLQLFKSMASRQPIQIADLRATPAYVAGNPRTVHSADVGGIRSMVNVPMLRDGEVTGVISVYRNEVHEFTEKQIELVANFGAQAVIAIENARLLSELRESLEQQTATADVLRVISASPGELEPVFRTMLEKATRICEAKFGTLFRFDGTAFGVSAQFCTPAELVEFQSRRGMFRPEPGTPLDRLMRTKRIEHTADAATEPVQGDAAKYGGARSIIRVPMLKDDVLVGAIVIYRQEFRPFTEKQVELLNNFAAQAVIAIENARLLAELRQRTADLSKSLEDLRTAQDRLVQTEKLASLGQLTAGIAHEIKNPLNFVNNFSSLSVELIDEMQEELDKVKMGDDARAAIADLAETLKGNLDKIAQHGKRADAIVKNMLLHSREGSGERRSVDVNALVEESLNLAYHGARAEKQGFNIALERVFDATAGEVDLYPQEVTRVLLNIIANGFYAAHKRKAQVDGMDFEPTIVASTRNLGDRVEIRIRDNGTGIPPEVKARMFNPFFTTKPAGEGTGLGLSISHDIIVKQHAGTIAVETQPGQFTEFAIVLPRRAAALGKTAETA